MIIVNTPNIAHKEIKESLGVVKGEIVQSRNVGRDILANLKTLVGGEIASYTGMIRQARTIATERMIKEAEKLDAGCDEIIVYGTAVKLK